MEVAVPMADFDFDSACTTPYVSAPSSPRGFGRYYTSAPTSPNSAAAFYNHFRDAGIAASSSVAPFNLEDQITSTTTGKNNHYHDEEDQKHEDFAFEFSGQLVLGSGEPVTATADELFEAGRIRPLKPPPGLQVAQFDSANTSISLTSSPNSPMSRIFRRRRNEDDFDPFAKASEETIRGRERPNPPASTGTTARGSRRVARSLSPLRGVSSNIATAAATTVATTKSGSKKWRLKDFFLFRSASEGRVTGKRGKDPLRKYTAVVVSNEVRNSSFRSTDSGSGSMRRALARDDSGSVGRSLRRDSVSLHEIHYAANRAVSEEMKRKTFLPYRQGLLGCLGFNPSMDGLWKAFGATAGVHRR